MSRPRQCACGCGQEIPERRTDGKPQTYVYGHNSRGRHNPRWKGGEKMSRFGYVLIHQPKHSRADTRGYVLEHVLVAERALGKALPPAAQVHHVNLDRSDNRPQNLVICPDDAYHKLLHQRIRAREACGHASWRPCRFCGEYDAPENVYTSKTGYSHHNECNREYQRLRKLGHDHAAAKVAILDLLAERKGERRP